MRSPCGQNVLWWNPSIYLFIYEDRDGNRVTPAGQTCSSDADKAATAAFVACLLKKTVERVPFAQCRFRLTRKSNDVNHGVSFTLMLNSAFQQANEWVDS